jgi:hypothetical protein
MMESGKEVRAANEIDIGTGPILGDLVDHILYSDHMAAQAVLRQKAVLNQL